MLNETSFIVILNDVMLNVIVRNAVVQFVIMLNVVMLSVALSHNCILDTNTLAYQSKKFYLLCHICKLDIVFSSVFSSHHCSSIFFHWIVQTRQKLFSLKDLIVGLFYKTSMPLILNVVILCGRIYQYCFLL